LYGASHLLYKAIAADDYNVIWSDQQALSFRTMFMGTYPRIPIFHADSKTKLIANRGWFESVVGHVFHYREWDSREQGKRDHAYRSALNAEAQGPAAQICFYIMVLARMLLDKRGFRSVEFVNHVHDSILTEVPNPEWVPDVVATIEEASQMAHEWVKRWFVVPLVMEHSQGESWGSLKEIKAHG
jgi:DNA polymerase I-like protein with 3'-5' exonuclease and polymerase domains